MVENQNSIDDILEKYARGETLTEPETALLDESIRSLPPVPMAEIWSDIERRIQADIYRETGGAIPARRRAGQYFIAGAFYLGAAVLACIILRAAIWSSLPNGHWAASDHRPRVQGDKSEVVTPSPRRPLKPRTQQVVLTLADNSEVLLDTLQVGAVIALGDHLSARKTNADELVYETDSGSSPTLSAWNRLAVGGQRKPFAFRLPDGSRVQLKPGSTFRYPLARSGRELAELEGEGWFDITPNSQQQLAILSPGGMTAQVLGTCFAIRARPGEQESRVSLISGALRISAGGDNRLLKYGGGVAFRNGRLVEEGLEAGAGLFGWSGIRTDVHFDRTEFSVAIAKIAALYGLKVYNPDKVKGIPVTGVFYRDQSSDKTLQQLEDLESGAAFFSRSGGRIVVTEASESQ